MENDGTGRTRDPQPPSGEGSHAATHDLPPEKEPPRGPPPWAAAPRPQAVNTQQRAQAPFHAGRGQRGRPSLSPYAAPGETCVSRYLLGSPKSLAHGPPHPWGLPAAAAHAKPHACTAPPTLPPRLAPGHQRDMPGCGWGHSPEPGTKVCSGCAQNSPGPTGGALELGHLKPTHLGLQDLPQLGTWSIPP